MNPSKQLLGLIAAAAVAASFAAGYMVSQPGLDMAISNSDQTGILARFDGIPNPTATSTPIPDSLFQLSADAALAPASDAKSNSILYYRRQNGQVSKISLADRSASLISETTLPKLSRIIWSPDRTKVISVYAAKTGSVYKSFDYASHQTATLGSDIGDAAFSPDSNEIVLAKINGDETDLVIANPDGSDPKVVLKSHLSGLALTWPSSNLISFIVRHDDGSGDDLYTVDLNGNLTKVLESQPNLKILWSTDGSKLLYSTVSNNQKILVLHDQGGEETAPVVVAADRCAWFLDSKSFVCLTDEAGLSAIKQVMVSDLSVKTLASELVANPETVFLSQLEDFLLFSDRTDHSLWAIRLPN